MGVGLGQFPPQYTEVHMNSETHIKEKCQEIATEKRSRKAADDGRGSGAFDCSYYCMDLHVKRKFKCRFGRHMDL